MKIVKLEAENVKRLVAVEITPEGNTVVIGGKNGAGKTSVLDSIMYALAGKSAVCEEPVRQGTRKAEVVCDLGDYIVKRSFRSAGGGSLSVTAKDGSKAASPQALLDNLVGSLTFDPLAFAGMKPPQQRETLRRLVGLDFTEMDAKRKALYDERTALGRDVAGRKGRLDSLASHDDAPKVEVSVAQLSKELEDAQTNNQAISADADRIRHCDKDIREGNERIAKLEQEIRGEREGVAASKKMKAEVVERRKGYKEIDTEPIRKKINSAEGVNRKVRENAARAALQAELTKTKQAYAKLTGQIDVIDDTKRQQLADAEFPVEGLSFDDDGVYFDDVPFSQSSSAEQLRVSVAMALAVNPKLKVLLIRDGSLLDEDNLKMIAEMAHAAGGQVWIERVGEGKECQVIIEDGCVKGQDLSEKPVD